MNRAARNAEDNDGSDARDVVVEWRRQGLHLATAVLVAPVLWLSEPWPTAILAGMAAAVVTADLARLRSAVWAQRLAAIVPGVFRRTEAGRFSGASLLALGFTATSALFSSRPAAGGMICLAAGDAAAALAGQLYRRRPGARDAAAEDRKTAAGSAACAVVSTAMIGLLIGPRPAAVLGGLVAAALERVTPGRWDNLSVPLGVALVLQAALD